jgi:hypothetical protein
MSGHCKKIQELACISAVICKKTERLSHFYLSFNYFLIPVLNVE